MPEGRNPVQTIRNFPKFIRLPPHFRNSPNILDFGTVFRKRGSKRNRWIEKGAHILRGAVCYASSLVLKNCRAVFFWGFYFPINKSLWTSSYLLFTAGIGALLLAILSFTIDNKQIKKPFWVFADL